MAKDRARDPKRVPSLGISDPISHVKVRTDLPKDFTKGGPESKANKTLAMLQTPDKPGEFPFHAGVPSNESPVSYHARRAKERAEGKIPVVKIKS